MRLGISSYTYTWAIGVPGSSPSNPLRVCGLLEKAISNGITVVQIADNLPLENLSEEETDLLRDFADTKGISLELGGRGLIPGHVMKCLKTAEAIGSPILRMVIDTNNYEPEVPEIIAIIQELETEFRSRKIRMAIENHDRLKAREFENIIQSVGSEWVGICLDSVNSMGAGEGFETVSDILLPYTINLHIKDFTIRRVSHKMGIIIEGAPAGKGLLNIRDILSRASETGICKSAILELWTPPEKSIEETIIKEEKWAEESIQYLKSLKL
ncbi:MAG TPA: TIM barrel protein [Bacteroidales bacterium]|nr:TIM barrel protein [Bacteroidales bacterium]